MTPASCPWTSRSFLSAGTCLPVEPGWSAPRLSHRLKLLICCLLCPFPQLSGCEAHTFVFLSAFRHLSHSSERGSQTNSFIGAEQAKEQEARIPPSLNNQTKHTCHSVSVLSGGPHICPVLTEDSRAPSSRSGPRSLRYCSDRGCSVGGMAWVLTTQSPPRGAFSGV